ncbi:MULTISPECIES: hypothetical protein [unclassified Yoonia]|uniref:hypothetical protein n=1 Tax=unclassified Yoonia TaxID=2629118 RepID=UPI002AFDE273|nr:MULTISPECIES: hypothetical protein [unclassified Yoonia]
MDELKERRFFALERSAGRPAQILRELLQQFDQPMLRYSYLRPGSISALKSLSGIHGFGEFPLHTDGAHLHHPPDFLVLMAPKVRTTPTLICDPQSVIDLNSEEAKQAVFSVKRQRRTYHVQFRVSKGGVSSIRYNPDIMIPKNIAAQDIQARMLELRKHAIKVQWEKFALLILDNRFMLHGRGQVSGTASYMRRLEVRLP